MADGRIELVDNGWSQHDMGCTTYDSMLNNWLEGHLWIRETFGAAARPKIGWSLDPFGLSTTQAVLQALMGFDGWFFTRVPGYVVDEGKKNQTLEFIWCACTPTRRRCKRWPACRQQLRASPLRSCTRWLSAASPELVGIALTAAHRCRRASSSLPDAQSEIFAHIFESYYCMPLPTYAFEWGEAKGAKPPNAANILELAHGLANITKQRAGWFRTRNVLIPWGCDYQYQNAALMYNATDWILDTINANPQWGVHVQYTTPSEYLGALQRSRVTLPVKDDKQTFFPYNTWSGYFTSRPKLKDISQRAHGPLAAAEVRTSVPSPCSASCAPTHHKRPAGRLSFSCTVRPPLARRCFRFGGPPSAPSRRPSGGCLRKLDVARASCSTTMPSRAPRCAAMTRVVTRHLLLGCPPHHLPTPHPNHPCQRTPTPSTHTRRPTPDAPQTSLPPQPALPHPTRAAVLRRRGLLWRGPGDGRPQRAQGIRGPREHDRRQLTARHRRRALERLRTRAVA